MSQHHQGNDSHLANFTGIIFILTFVVIFAVISSGSQSLSLIPAVPTGESQEAAEVVPTATVEPAQPSSTPLPAATATSLPTDRPEPVLPSSTPIPAATATQEPVADTAQPAENTSAHDPALVERGATLFALCAACHGPDAHGIPNLGKDLVASEFVHSLTDEELLNFIKTGRPLWDPLNTTGIDMPPKGGNPALTDEEIIAIIAYVRSLAASGS
jgi:disulfide bond formation protein DsbB